MEIEHFIGLLIAPELRMSRYDDNTLENAFKTQLQFNRGRGRGRLSNRGRSGRIVDQKRLQDYYEHEQKYDQHPLSQRGG